ncbi:MAG: phosphate signaling complex protein PhoU [Myxococcota bacterium]
MEQRQHIVKSYTRELEELRRNLVLMAGRVEDMIGAAVRAVVEEDIDLARRVIAEDKLVNRAELDIDARCLQLLARWQPMASDLRVITLTLKMVTDLERIGDLAVNISNRALDMATQPSAPISPKISRMGRAVRAMVHSSIEAFVLRDPDLARQVIAKDDEVDELYHTLFRQQLRLMNQNATLVERGILLQSVAKYLERIGDHSTNLAEQVIHMVHGRDVRHPRSRRPEPV